MADFIDAHALKPPIARRFAFDNAREAYRLAASGDAFGKIVVGVAAG